MTLSIIIPAYRDVFLNPTIQSILDNAVGDIEVIPVIDGYKHDPLPEDDRVKPIVFEKNQGMRGAINAGIAAATGKFIMKCDSHCAFAPGFDKVLTDSCEEDWIMIPRRYSLDEVTWGPRARRPYVDYGFLTFPDYDKGMFAMTTGDWFQKARDRNDPKYDIDETMVFQGSCWMANRDFFLKLVGELNLEIYGGFGLEQQELALKYWLTGGKVMVNKNTWYAHLKKRKKHYQSGCFPHWYKEPNHMGEKRTAGTLHLLKNQEPGLKHDFVWLVKKFGPLPGWGPDWEQRLEEIVKKETLKTL